MSVTGFELVTITSDYITVDLLVWRRYKVPAIGIVEMMLDINPHLALLHRESCFLPIGTQLRIPIDPDILSGRPPPRRIINVFSKVG